MSDQFTLDHWLGRAYHASIGGNSVDDAFLERLNNDAAMRIDAGKKLASITDDLAKQDYISKIQRETLTRILAKVNANG